jgi:hypothetical protein
MVRGLLKLITIKSNSYSSSKELEFFAEYDNSIPEEQRFAKASPSGRFVYNVDNPAALEQFVLGGKYYIDFTPVD